MECQIRLRSGCNDFEISAKDKSEGTWQSYDVRAEPYSKLTKHIDRKIFYESKKSLKSFVKDFEERNNKIQMNERRLDDSLHLSLVFSCAPICFIIICLFLYNI